MRYLRIFVLSFFSIVAGLFIVRDIIKLLSIMSDQARFIAACVVMIAAVAAIVTLTVYLFDDD